MFDIYADEQSEKTNSDFNDAIELMFFAYRDIADPTDFEAHGFGQRITVFCLWPNPGIFIVDLLDILRVTKQSLARVLILLTRLH